MVNKEWYKGAAETVLYTDTGGAVGYLRILDNAQLRVTVYKTAVFAVRRVTVNIHNDGPVLICFAVYICYGHFICAHGNISRNGVGVRFELR